MRTALFILLLLCRPIWAAVTADMIIVPDYGAQGILTRTVLSNIVIGAHGNLSYSQGSQLGGGAASTWQRTYVGATVGTATFQTPVTVNSVSYGGSATNWVRFDSVTNLPDEYAKIEFPNGANSTVTNVLACGLRTFTVTNATGSDISLDTLILYDNAGGAWAVCQLQMTANDGGIGLRSHAASGGGSSFGGTITITPAKAYFVVLYRDSLGGRVCVRVYDPAVWSMVGESISSMNTGNTYLLELPVGYIGNPPLNTYLGPTFLKFDASNSDYSNIVAVPPVILNGAVLNGFHTQ